eukprot:CAMPEP_0185568294 /NCGR_PEP_ID=MMETSP0434-20130131/1300_1 /TAXON_ID=626734 ORGANISM="Favella taraikaensis, Strain Fe Narragansett Bay" /NCGR_SAMPLE_ID=MMETSP0434 /ASSEMBLY_ACC=CAM_ASM_000379 /LENGTH=62 /DNA_ID=CAMNT_0028182765 /DNA_START=268 /DNA_END=456 /DNA_ORIENTATION=-
MDNKISIVDCPPVDGLRCVIQNIKMPMMMTNRSIPQVYYVEETPEALVFIASSRGTESVVTE